MKVHKKLGKVSYCHVANVECLGVMARWRSGKMKIIINYNHMLTHAPCDANWNTTAWLPAVRLSSRFWQLGLLPSVCLRETCLERALWVVLHIVRFCRVLCEVSTMWHESDMREVSAPRRKNFWITTFSGTWILSVQPGMFSVCLCEFVLTYEFQTTVNMYRLTSDLIDAYMNHECQFSVSYFIFPSSFHWIQVQAWIALHFNRIISGFYCPSSSISGFSHCSLLVVSFNAAKMIKILHRRCIELNQT